MIEVTIPLRTGRGQNDRGATWHKKAKRNKSERNLAFWSLYDAHPKPKTLLNHIEVTLTRIGPTNGLDDDNLAGSLKALRDGVADWLYMNDRDPRLKFVYKQERNPKWQVRIQVAL